MRAPIGVPGWGEARVKGRVDPRGVEGRVEAGAGGGGVAGGRAGGGGGVV